MFIFTGNFLLKMKNVLLIIIAFITNNSYAQGEANIWYFGEKAGLDFNSGSPVALTDGQMITHEGCATISNTKGQLLFYTDGVSIWNKNHQIMSNGTGLSGNSSSTQSAIIVPKPNSSTIYYVFTVGAFGSDGLYYSEIDMSLNSGLGDVNSNKNIQLTSPTCEKLTAIKNGDGYWVVTHGYLNNSFFAYSVTDLGVNQTPVISNTGDIADHDFTGYLKISPDGKKIINCSGWSKTELFDFDSFTGIVKNPIQILLNRESSYGAEFSPSGNILYIANGGYIYQFDLKAADIPSTKKVIYQRLAFDNVVIDPLQLAPNGKIYGTVMDQNYICSINNPDVLGTGCNFVFNSISLGTGKGRIGLPQFIQSYFNIGIVVKNNCFGESTSFSLNGNEAIVTATWDFGDGNTSTDTNPTHTYASAGTYTVSVTATSASGTSTKTRDVVISTIPIATQPQDLLVCDDDYDGLFTFDLMHQDTAILNGQDPNLFAVTYSANNVTLTTPNNYINKLPYQQETITAEVSNKANGECKSITTFIIDVFDKPLPNTSVNIPILNTCDNTSVGTDTDGRVIFDLTQSATTILNGQSASQFLLSYYRDVALTQHIVSPTTYQNMNPTETIYVKMVNTDNSNCTATTAFTIQVLALPIITNSVDLKQCDDDIDGFSIFNLKEAITKITTNAATETITFFKTLTEAQNNTNPILDPTTYTNQNVSVDVVFARVDNSNGCFRIAQLNLIVSTTQIPLTFTKAFTQCDDVVSGSNTDGIASFDFSGVTNDIQTIFPAGQLLNITYYRNLADALAEKNAIPDIGNYSNIGYPNSQNIYIRVDSQLNNDCLGLGSYITLTVESIPIVSPIAPFIHCDDDQDGNYAFDVTALDAQIKNGKNVTVAYFDSNNNPLASPLPSPFVTATQTLKVTITNNTATTCSYDTTISFIVDDLPEAFPVATALTTVCEDEIDPSQQDGKYAFDTSNFQTTILGEQTGMDIHYFDEDNNPLPSPLPNPFITSTQNVKVEVVNPINTSCTATTIIPFVVHPIPNINLTGHELVCSNLPTFTKVIDAGLQDGSPIENYTYAWSFNGNTILGETNYTLMVNTEGIYTVKVTNGQGCSRTRTITVSASDIAAITNVDIVDLADSNSITVSVTGNGDYVYGLDDEFGVYQEDSIFNNVSAGIHTVFIKDLNGCGIVPKEVAVLGIPNYFTPNQDGYNDTWNIKGVNASFNTNTIIYIFDRYSKLVKQINPNGEGWDGTYIGKSMPADDYWYSVQLEDGRLMKGHFSLKR
ncbi:Microbial collagenase precursor [compost metagenome]